MLHARLSALMFLQYAVMGAWVPLFTLLLKEWHFGPQETAWCCATAAMGALIAPLPWGQVADRCVAAQKCICFCSFACGVCLLMLAELSEPLPVFLLSLLYWFFMYPVVSLGTSLTFRHLRDPQREFGRVRLWGTVGWVVIGWMLGLWFHMPDWLIDELSGFGISIPTTADSLRAGAACAFVLCAYSLTLPDTPPSPCREVDGISSRSSLRRFFDAPLIALSMLRRPSLGILGMCMFGLYVTIPFYSQLTPLLLSDLGVPRSMLPVLLTLSQSLEVASLWGMPFILFHLDQKGTLLVGMLSWVAVMTVMSLGQPFWLVAASLGLNGIFICCFIVAAQMVINRHAPSDVRASAQAMLQFVNGFGLLIGHVLVGILRDWFADDFVPIFAIAAVLSAALTLLFLLTFRSVRQPTDPLST